MKKSTRESLRNYLNGDTTIDLSSLRDEINTEWDRLTAKARANKDTYDAAHEVFLTVLTDTPQTAKELYETTDEWPEGFTQGKLNYALRATWADEVNKTDNGKSTPNTYTCK